MQARRQNNTRATAQLLADYPRKHLLLAAVVLAALALISLLPAADQGQARIQQPLAIPLDNASAAIIEEESPTPSLPWQEQKVRAGDNLSLIFQRVGLGAGEVHAVAQADSEQQQLTRLYPGQTLAFQIDGEGKLQALKHIHNRLRSDLYQRSDEQGFVFSTTVREPETRQHSSSARIDSSLFLAALDAGLSQSMTMELANIFGGVIDFVYDIRQGDHFTVLYETRYLDDERFDDGPILAAEFSNQGETYTAFRYVDPQGNVGYYSADGVSMRKPFLRAPLDFSRISSNFNPNRLHPILKTARPHRGIDYAASTGTPVFAAGDGRVVEAAYNNASGNYVVIKHGEQYTTKYLHLNKRAVRKGQKVSQGKIIGWVGATGYATGPHLHYEFLVNGVHRNPRTILKKLPKADSLNEQDKPAFLAQIHGLQMQLASLSQARQSLASTDDNSRNTL